MRPPEGRARHSDLSWHRLVDAATDYTRRSPLCSPGRDKFMSSVRCGGCELSEPPPLPNTEEGTTSLLHTSGFFGHVARPPPRRHHHQRRKGGSLRLRASFLLLPCLVMPPHLDTRGLLLRHNFLSTSDGSSCKLMLSRPFWAGLRSTCASPAFAAADAQPSGGGGNARLGRHSLLRTSELSPVAVMA